MASLTLPVVIAITHTETTINIAWVGTTMTIARTAHTQAEIATMTAKSAVMPTNIVTAIDVIIIMTRDAKEATSVMIGKEEIAIVLAVKASHIM